MRKLSILAASAAAFLIAGCSLDITVEETNDGIKDEWPETITCVLPEPETKTTLEYTGGRMYTSWKTGDVVSVVSGGLSANAATYTATASGSSVTFNRTTNGSFNYTPFLIYYPGDRITGDISYITFSYKNQVQSKSAPMAHLGNFQTMRVQTSSFQSGSTHPTISFSDADQSSCMRFSLSGMTFNSPSLITLNVYRSGSKASVFLNTNYLQSYFSDGSGQSVPSTSYVADLNLGLSGYGSAETSLTAFMMMSNKDVTLNSGDVVRVSVTCADGVYYSELNLSSAMTLHGGHCHSVVISSGWEKEGNVSGIEPPDYTQYEYDGEVVVLQQGTEDLLNIILLGDGFINEDFVNGTYDALMRKAYSSLFDIQPYIYYKDRFNVKYVKAVSPQRTYATNTGSNGAENSGTITKFSTSFTPNSTNTTGDYATAEEYAKYALGTDANTLVQEAVIVVIANQRCHAGTCHMSYSNSSSAPDYGKGHSIVFMGRGTSDADLKGLIHHEALGHGFGKLADEYSHNSYYRDPTPAWSNLQTYHRIGFHRNIDIYVDQDYLNANASSTYPLTTQSNVYWNDLFGTANNYESLEGLGIYEGANTVLLDFCRPTDAGESCVMHSHGPQFNAPCRRQIIYRLKCLSGDISGNKWGDATDELNPFLQWDAANYIPSVNSAPAAPAAPAKARQSMVEVDYMWSAPVMRPGHWENGVFIEEKQ